LPAGFDAEGPEPEPVPGRGPEPDVPEVPGRFGGFGGPEKKPRSDWKNPGFLLFGGEDGFAFGGGEDDFGGGEEGGGGEAVRAEPEAPDEVPVVRQVHFSSESSSRPQ
jgi:hypothetical protein